MKAKGSKIQSAASVAKQVTLLMNNSFILAEDPKVKMSNPALKTTPINLKHVLQALAIKMKGKAKHFFKKSFKQRRRDFHPFSDGHSIVIAKNSLELEQDIKIQDCFG